MDGRRAPDPLHLAVGAAATAGGALQRVIGFGIDTARRLPGVDPVLVTLEERGTETLRGADELADRVLHAVLRKVVQVALQEVDLTTFRSTACSTRSASSSAPRSVSVPRSSRVT